MSSRARATKTPAQTRLAEVVSAYIQHLIRLQAICAESPLDAEVVPQPNDKAPSHDYFCATHTPPISVEKYTDRLVTYMHCSPEVFIFALAYLRRLVLAGFPLHMRSVHRLLLTSVLVALKCRDDVYYHMSFYAEVGGVTSKDLGIMEIRFLSDLIHFRGEVSVEEYQLVMNDITVTTQRRVPKCMSNESELSSQGGISACVSTSNSSASTPNEVVGISSSLPTFAPTWTGECQVYPGNQA